MQLLWIGCLESDEEFLRKAEKGYDLASAQLSQKNILDGIEKVSGLVFDSINGPVLLPYPLYRERIIEPVVWKHKADAYDISVGFKNYKYLNRVYCKQAMIRAAQNWIDRRYNGGALTIFVYSMRSGPMAAACYIKRRIKKAYINLIITDLPQYMDLGQSKIKSLLKKIDWFSIKMMQRKIDGFVLYAEKMAEFLNIPNGRWILMEGSYDVNELSSQRECTKKVVMYSGKLDNKYGIPMLLDAFMSIENSEIELWLTGSGNAENYINECAKKDKRIKFFGFMKSRKEVISLQNQAQVLINMRLPSEKASSYCFPSKLFEYMASGIPVISFKLEGIPEEYNRYLYVIEEESTLALSTKIKEVFAKERSDLESKGEAARDFIISNKSSIEQCKRIFEWNNKLQKRNLQS